MSRGPEACLSVLGIDDELVFEQLKPFLKEAGVTVVYCPPPAAEEENCRAPPVQQGPPRDWGQINQWASVRLVGLVGPQSTMASGRNQPHEIKTIAIR